MTLLEIMALGLLDLAVRCIGILGFFGRCGLSAISARGKFLVRGFGLRFLSGTRGAEPLMASTEFSLLLLVALPILPLRVSAIVIIL